MTILDTARKRYSTKSFDPAKKIPAEKAEALRELLRLAPSSTNSQPWKFIVATTEEGKARLGKAACGPYAYNFEKILRAGFVVAFCARTKVEDAFLARLTEQEQQDGRYATEAARNEQHEKRSGYFHRHESQYRDFPEWTARQTYLNLGAFLLGAGALDLDAVPIEGFDASVLDAEFGLAARGLAPLALAAVGYHAEDDFNFKLPKSRLARADIIEEI